MNVHLVLLDQVKQEIEGPLENLQSDFVVGGFHVALGR
jgi:hypothetical protein